MTHYKIKLADALNAHEDALKEGGGAIGVVSLSALEGALGRPYHGYHRRIWEKAAALLHGLATAHAFADGNKRTAWVVTLTMIDRSGYDLEVGDEQLDDVIVDVVTGHMSQDDLEQWFRSRLINHP